MKFYIRRTSRLDETQPCEGAIKEKGIGTSYGMWSTVEKARADANGKGWFFREGTFNHRKEGPGVAHDYEIDAWSIEIPTLDALLKFSAEHGDLIISTDDDLYGKGPKIEIYDTYRE